MENLGGLEKKWLTVDAAAVYLDCSTSTIYKMIEANPPQIPFTRVAGTKMVRIPKKELDEQLRRGIVKPLA